MIKNPKFRDKALQRALKFAKLFQEDTFEAVLDSLGNPNKEQGRNDFDTALQNAGITYQEDKDWLYNYLQYMNVEIPNEPDPKKNMHWKRAREAAAVTGW